MQPREIKFAEIERNMYFTRDTMTALDTLIVSCSILGLLISMYFTLVYYRLMKPDAVFVPAFCRLDEATCQYLMSTRNARILGAPNFVLGLLYYCGMIPYIVVTDVHNAIPLTVVTFVSLFTVLLGVYLVYGLLYKLKTHCVLCYTSHACNFIIFLALIGRRFGYV